MTDLLRVPVEDLTQAGEARRRTLPLGQHLRFSAVDLGRVALLVTEAGTNLAKHARGGELLIRPLHHGGVAGLELLAVDRGPGMANPVRSEQDGVSTTGTPGTGLGALRRTASQFDLYSEPGRGTVVLCRYWAGAFDPAAPPRPLELGAVSRPLRDEDPCGDGWAVEQTTHRSQILVVDGLGHGVDAAAAAGAAERLFRARGQSSPGALVEALHAGLRSTRGAALAVLEVDHAAAAVRYAGVGNIAARLITDEDEQHLVSLAGTVGHEVHQIREFAYPWADARVLVMHSDGLTARWRLADHPGLAARHPAVIAAVLYRDYRRGRDDATVVVARRRAAPPAAGPPEPP